MKANEQMTLDMFNLRSEQDNFTTNQAGQKFELPAFDFSALFSKSENIDMVENGYSFHGCSWR